MKVHNKNTVMFISLAGFNTCLSTKSHTVQMIKLVTFTLLSQRIRVLIVQDETKIDADDAFEMNLAMTCRKSG